MSTFDLRDLALRTVTRPAEAAGEVLSLRPPRSVLWTALVLMMVLQTIVVVLAGMVQGVPMAASPLMLFALATVEIVLSVHAITLLGRSMGGKGTLDDVLVLIVWLQALTVPLQAAVQFLALVLPGVVSVLFIAVAVIGIYISLHFVNVAHRFQSLGRSFLVLLLSGLAVLICLVVFSALLGAQILGVPANV